MWNIERQDDVDKNLENDGGKMICRCFRKEKLDTIYRYSTKSKIFGLDSSTLHVDVCRVPVRGLSSEWMMFVTADVFDSCDSRPKNP